MKFSAPTYTGPRVLQASYTAGTRPFLKIKCLGHGINHKPPSTTKVKERVEVHLYSSSSPSVFSRQVIRSTLVYLLLLPKKINTKVLQKYTTNSEMYTY